MSDELSFDCVEQLVDLIRSTGLPADQEPDKLNMPGAWVTVDQIIPANLAGGWEVQAIVFLIVQDQDYKRASRKLAECFNKLRQVASPDGPVRPQGVIMPGDPTPLPALRVPINLYT